MTRAPGWRQRISLGVLTPLLLAIALWAPNMGLVGGVYDAAQATALVSPTLTITIPAPIVGVAEGPVGTNVTMQGSGATPGDTLQFGYVSQTAGCAGADTPISTAPLVIVRPDGGFAVAFSWPSNAATAGADYGICAHDMTTITNPPIASTDLFKVDSATAPSITVTPVDANGTPLPTPAANGALYAGGYAQIVGANFFPGGNRIFVQETADIFTANLYNPQQALKVISGDAISLQDGAFTIVVQLPEQQGTFYLNVLSTDGDGPTNQLPSLLASQQVTISAPPATPTPTASATPVVTPTPASRGAKTPAPSASRVAAIVGLGGVSVLLFLIGVILLVSAALTPWPRV